MLYSPEGRINWTEVKPLLEAQPWRLDVDGNPYRQLRIVRFTEPEWTKEEAELYRKLERNVEDPYCVYNGDGAEYDGEDVYDIFVAELGDFYSPEGELNWPLTGPLLNSQPEEEDLCGNKYRHLRIANAEDVTPELFAKLKASAERNGCGVYFDDEDVYGLYLAVELG